MRKHYKASLSPPFLTFNFHDGVLNIEEIFFLCETMEKTSLKNKHTIKQSESLQEKFEILDERYQKMKEILKQVLKDLKNEREKKDILREECAKLASEVKGKDDLLKRMQSVSEAVVDEFSVLKVKCEMETEAANDAIKRATMYIHANQRLIENPQCNLQAITKTSDSNVLHEDSLCESLDELKVLSKLNSDLRTEVASLKTQLSKEIEKHIMFREDFDVTKKLYEQEMNEHKGTAEKLKSLKFLYDSFMDAESSEVDSQVYNGEYSKSQDVAESVNDSNSAKASNPIEKDLIAKLTVLENQKSALQKRVKELEKQILNVKRNGSFSEPLCILPPPPPPPPPSFNPLKSLITFINAGKKSARKTTVTAKEGFENDHQKAMSEMISAIKKGNIQLKHVSKTIPEKEESNPEPLALVEMKNILETLKRSPFKASENQETGNDTLNFHSETAINTEVPLNNINGNCQNNGEFDSPLEENIFAVRLNTENKFQICGDKDLEDYLRDGDLSPEILSPSNGDYNANKFTFLESLHDDSNKVEEFNESSII